MLRREIAEPFYDKKEAAKIAAQEATLATPKLPIRGPSIIAAEPSIAMGEQSLSLFLSFSSLAYVFLNLEFLSLIPWLFRLKCLWMYSLINPSIVDSLLRKQ